MTVYIVGNETRLTHQHIYFSILTCLKRNQASGIKLKINKMKINNHISSLFNSHALQMKRTGKKRNQWLMVEGIKMVDHK